MILVQMSQEQYIDLKEDLISVFAVALREAHNLSHEEALEKAEKEHHAILPEGTRTKDHYLYLLKSGGSKVGYIWYGPIERPYGVTAFIYYLKVDEGFRRKGLGKAALLEIEKEAANSNINQIELFVFSDNFPAIELYKSLGYRELRSNDRGAVLSKAIS